RVAERVDHTPDEIVADAHLEDAAGGPALIAFLAVGAFAEADGDHRRFLELHGDAQAAVREPQQHGEAARGMGKDLGPSSRRSRVRMLPSTSWSPTRMMIPPRMAGSTSVVARTVLPSDRESCSSMALRCSSESSMAVVRRALAMPACSSAIASNASAIPRAA